MDLQEFINRLEAAGELKTIKGADTHLEVGALTEIAAKKKAQALLFDELQGYAPGYRIITNLLATPSRIALAFGLPADTGPVDLVLTIKEKFKSLKPLPPVEVDAGPILENTFTVESLDLSKFPAPKWHEHDGGRYLGTGCLVIMRDPDGHWVNTGTYRVQFHEKDLLGLFISPGHQGRIIMERYWALGKSCPVVVVPGSHPLVWIPAFLGFPWGQEEFAITGGLSGQRLPVVTGNYTGLPIPAAAEIAIEGECPPETQASHLEGPFGEYTGYYASEPKPRPVIRVKRVLHRHRPVILGAPPLKPPAEGTGTHILHAANIWQELDRLGIPGIRGVWEMEAGAARFLTVVSIEQKYAGHAKQVAMAAMSGPEGAFAGRFVIVVDSDIDPSDTDEVLWAMSTRCDPATTIDIIHGCWSTPLDPSITPEKRARSDFSNSRAIINACRPYHWRKEFPPVNCASEGLTKRVWEKYRSLFEPGKVA